MSIWNAAFQRTQRELRGGTLGRTLSGKARSMAGRSAQKVKLAFLRRRYPRVQWGAGMTIRGRLSIEGPRRVVFGDNCFLDTATGRPNRIQTLDSDARIAFGDGCYLKGVDISAQVAVSVGRRTMIGECLIFDTDFHSVEINRWNPQAPVKHRPVVIGDNVWIGNKTIVLKGVSIGDNSLVGAGTVVREAVPTNVVVVGNPHRIVKHLDSPIAPYEI